MPPSKSMSIRVLAAIFLSGRDTLLKGAWPKDGTQVCEDVQAAYRVVRSVGSQFVKEDISPDKVPPGRDHSRRQLDCGESALALRMFAPIVALSSYIYCLRGRTTLITRPVDFVIEGLRELGCWCESLNTLPTLSIIENLKHTAGTGSAQGRKIPGQCRRQFPVSERAAYGPSSGRDRFYPGSGASGKPAIYRPHPECNGVFWRPGHP